MILSEFLQRLEGVRGNDKQYSAKCPAHEDKHASLSVSQGEKGILIHCHTGCTVYEILDALGLKASDLFHAPPIKKEFQPAIRYEYLSEDGTVAYIKYRLNKSDGSKTFYFEQTNGTKNMKGVRRLPYNLPSVVKDDNIYFVEGEKAANCLIQRKITATTLDSGANSRWCDYYSKYFKGKNVYILPDNDPAGEQYAQVIANNLNGVARAVFIGRLPNLPSKGDVYDWFEAGNALENLYNADFYTLVNNDKGKKTEYTEQEIVPFNSISSAELVNSDFGALRWLIEGLLHQGFGLLVAAPKTGKSWLSADMCISIAIGSDFWGHKTIKTGTLYLALEDSFRRVQGRVKKLLNDKTPPDNFRIATTARDIDDGFEAQIDLHMKEHPDTGLIILDVLQRVRSKGGSRGKNAYEFDSAEMTRFKAIADKHNLLLLCVHHDGKVKLSDDPMAHISGSNGIAGNADIAMIITKESRMSNKARVTIISREMGDKQVDIEFNKDACRWDYVGLSEEVESCREEDEYNKDPVVITIKGLLQDNPMGVMRTASELLIDMSRYAGSYEEYSAKSIGKKIPHIAHKLYHYDKIVHVPPVSSKIRVHTFKHELATNATLATNDTEQLIL